jgi:DnaK suppressor protein
MNRKKVVAADRKVTLRVMLEERRREIATKLRSLRESLPAEASVPRDDQEQSVDDFVRDVDFALMEMKSQSLGRIDDALRRLDAGTYGTCTECDGEISEARLTALPFAPLCRDCQQAIENRSAEQREARVFERYQKEFLPAFR